MSDSAWIVFIAIVFTVIAAHRIISRRIGEKATGVMLIVIEALCLILAALSALTGILA